MSLFSCCTSKEKDMLSSWYLASPMILEAMEINIKLCN